MKADIFASAKTKAVLTSRGETVMRSYDWIGPHSKGRYRLTRRNGKFGILKLLEESTVEILEPTAIRPPKLEDMFLYGITSAQLETDAVLVDSTGKILQKGIGIWVIDDKLVAVEKQENKYVLYNPLNDRCTAEYSDFEVFETYIETHEDALKGLINRDLVEVFKPEYKSVKPFGDTCFLAEKTDGTEVLGNPNWEKKIQADEVFPEKNGFVCIRSKTRYGYVNVQTGARTQFILLDAQDFDDRDYAKVVHPGLGACWMDRKFQFLPARED